MRREDDEDTTIYKVVLNHEEQYSIWPADRENALGWNDAGVSGTKQECLDYIKEVWTDMRPLSRERRWKRTHAPSSKRATTTNDGGQKSSVWSPTSKVTSA